jgi:hypothetical protein
VGAAIAESCSNYRLGADALSAIGGEVENARAIVVHELAHGGLTHRRGRR